MKKYSLIASILPLSFVATTAFSAISIDLSHTPVAALKGLLSNEITLKEKGRSTDFNQTLHVRVQQMYQEYPVFGADAVLHIPHGNQSVPNAISQFNAASTMNGIFYQGLQRDLQGVPAYIFNEAQAQKAIENAINAYQNKYAKINAVHPQSRMLVYVDKNKQAHFAYEIRFDAPPLKAGEAPRRMIYIVDAMTMAIYRHWNDIKTIDTVYGGGFGGNKKMGKLVYDGLAKNLSKLVLSRDAFTQTCYLQNDNVVVRDRRKYDDIVTFPCTQADPKHDNVYWDGDRDAVNGGYSPSNDALYEGGVIKNMYQDWYHVPVLTRNGKPMLLTMVVHEKMDNAYWDGEQMTFGDGIVMFYPLTSLGVAAHEISHGFTEQHADLIYDGQSGGMNESFSDMAAQAAELYAYGKNSWQIGPEIVWLGGALRYMDQPSKDCSWIPLSPCSIDDASQYSDSLDVHYSSGVYNHFFYFLGTSSGWNARRAFDVMVKANQDYWTSNTSFEQGACGVIQAAKDYGYDTATVINAFNKVKIDTSQC
jgi:pseudolysin